MRRIFVFAFLLVSALSFGQEEMYQLNWLTNLEEAKSISQDENKNILIYFTGSDWCTPCVALKKDFFQTEVFSEKSKDFVLVKIDYPRRSDIITAEQKTYNKKVIAKYNTDKTFPKLLMLNSNGREIGKLSGYSSYNTYKDTSHHIAFVDKFAKQSH